MSTHHMKSTSQPHILIIGAGMAGLTAASALTRSSFRVTLVDTSERAGGRLATEGTIDFEALGKQWTFPNEHGLHGVFFQYRNMRQLLAIEGLLGRLRPTQGQEFVFPMQDGELGIVEIGETIQNSWLPSLLALGAVYLQRNFFSTLMQEHPARLMRAFWDLNHALAFNDNASDIAYYDRFAVSDFIRTWPDALKRLVGALTRSGMFAEPHEVSLAHYLMGIRYYVMAHKRASRFEVFAHDTQTDLIGPLCEAIRTRGGGIQLSTRAERLLFTDSVDGGQACGAGLEDGQYIQADAVIMALDPHAAKAVFIASDRYADFLTELELPRTYPSVVARIWTDKDVKLARRTSGVLGSAEANAFFWLHRLQASFMNWHHKTGGAVLECHIYGDQAREAAGQSDSQVLSRVKGLVGKAWPELEGHIVHAHLQRNIASQVPFGPGSLAKLPSVTTAIPRLVMCGDWVTSGWPVFHLEQATTTGLQAAQAVALQMRQAGLMTADASEVLPQPLPPFPLAPSVATMCKAVQVFRRMGFLSKLKQCTMG